MRPAKTPISLGIFPVWSESSLSAWRKLGSLATHWAHSEDSDQTGRMPRLIWVFAGRRVILLVLSWGDSTINAIRTRLSTKLKRFGYMFICYKRSIPVSSRRLEYSFGFEGRMWDVIVSVPDHCLSFYFAYDRTRQCIYIYSIREHTNRNKNMPVLFDLCCLIKCIFA